MYYVKLKIDFLYHLVSHVGLLNWVHISYFHIKFFGFNDFTKN